MPQHDGSSAAASSLALPQQAALALSRNAAMDAAARDAARPSAASAAATGGAARHGRQQQTQSHARSDASVMQQHAAQQRSGSGLSGPS